MASLADSHPAYAVSKITSASCPCAFTALRTSRPLPSGMRRSVTMRSKASSVSALTASVTPAASATRWPRLRRRRARVERAEVSSSTTRMSAMASVRGHGRGDEEPRAPVRLRLDVNVAPVGGHDAPHDGETEPRSPRLLREEGLEDPPPLLRRDAAAGVGHGDQDVAVDP